MAFPQLLTYWFRRSWTFSESLEMKNAKFWNYSSLDFEVSWIINMGTFFNSQFSAHKYMGEWNGLLISGNFFSFSSHYLPISPVDGITCHFHKKSAFCASCGACFFSCGDLISSLSLGKTCFFFKASWNAFPNQETRIVYFFPRFSVIFTTQIHIHNYFHAIVIYEHVLFLSYDCRHLSIMVLPGK